MDFSSGAAEDFVAEALKTLRWDSDAAVDADLNDRLHDVHRLNAFDHYQQIETYSLARAVAPLEGTSLAAE